MNPFPPVIRTFEILFHPFTAGSTGGRWDSGTTRHPRIYRVVSNFCENVGVTISA